MLFAKIDVISKKVVFSGAGTFNAKDTIKSLGSARWNGADKSWEVSGCELSEKQLQEIFPEIQVEVLSAELLSAGLVSSEDISSEVKKEENNSLPSSYSVSQLSNQIKSVLKQAFPRVLYVHGVLSSVKRSADGRIFMELAEQDKPDEVIRCVIWRDEQQITAGLKKAGFNLETELQVMFAVEVDLNKKWAAVSLSVQAIVAEYTISKIRAQREQTNEKLKLEGIFSNNKTLSLPFLPKKLGIITSSGGTVINDFIDSLNSANFGFELFWYKSSVQGQAAKKKLLKAIKELQKQKLDAVLIFRGGGSAADLSIFNDYDIAKAICLCPLPVLSAIGHQEDQSSVQDVSQQCFGVPKDLGHYFATIIINHRRNFTIASNTISDLSLRLLKQTEKEFLNISKSVFALSNSIILAAEQGLARISKEFPRFVISLLEREEKNLSKNIIPTLHLARQQCEFGFIRASEYFKSILSFSERLILEKEKEVAGLERVFENISPRKQLERGFAIVRNLTAKSVVTRADKIKSGESLEIEFFDNTIKVIVGE